MLSPALALLLLTTDPVTANLEAPSLSAPESLPDGSQRWSFLVTYGDEDCPPAVGDEIIVCARLPESERYRIPEPLREQREDIVGGQSWTSHVESYENIARLTRPDSCSPVGSYGYTGCTAKALREWFAERQLAKTETDYGEKP